MKMKSLTSLVATLAIASAFGTVGAVIAASPAAAAGSYTITDLGALSAGIPPSSRGISLNAVGVVVGDSLVSAASQEIVRHAVRFSGGGVADLGTLAPGDTSLANAVNSTGVAVGWSGRDSNTAVEFGGGSVVPLSPAGDADANATGINDAGTIVGWHQPSIDSVKTAVRFTANRTVAPLGSLARGEPSEALALDAAGDAVGDVVDANGQTQAVLFRGGRAVALPSPAGSPGGGATAVSPTGSYIVGWAIGNGPSFVAVRFRPGMPAVALSPPSPYGSLAYGVNSLGTAVGQADSWGALFQGGTTVALTSLLPADSGWLIESGNAINDRGEITGVGLKNGVEHAFLMKPPIRQVPLCPDPANPRFLVPCRLTHPLPGLPGPLSGPGTPAPTNS